MYDLELVCGHVRLQPQPRHGNLGIEERENAPTKPNQIPYHARLLRRKRLGLRVESSRHARLWRLSESLLLRGVGGHP